MVLVASNRAFDVLPLLGDAGLIVVVEAEALGSDRQTHRDCQSVLVRGVQGGLRVLDAPGADGIAAVCGDGRKVDISRAGAPDEIRPAFAHQRVAAVESVDFDANCAPLAEGCEREED